MTQLTDLFKGLLALEGHITRAQDLEGGAATAPAATATATETEATPRLGVLQHLLLLGGRPMHAGHNLDVDEPFDVLPAANDDDRAPVCGACG